MNSTSYRISGHEGFPCRYTWLTKAVRGLRGDSKLFGDEDRAMVRLGVGKNMVRSIRFWSLAAGFAAALPRAGHTVTDLGKALLGEHGFDPYLEDIRTLWLIHWHVSTQTRNPLLAWDFFLNRWQEPELIRSRVLKLLQQEAVKQDEKISRVTVEQHFDTFLHTYVPTRGRKGEIQEDNLDCPLVELELIVKVGERPADTRPGRNEPIYAFRREEKADITPGLFIYCLNDFWEKRHSTEATLPFQIVAHGQGGPGQVFKLPEDDIRERLTGLEAQTEGAFTYLETASQQQLQRNRQRSAIEWLERVYETEAAYA